MLRSVRVRFGDLFRLHQHGLSHRNHQVVGRKSEFGGQRSKHEQRRDIALGRTHLRNLFGSAIEPVFTPPWNRCDQSTVDALIDLGFEVLSRDTTAPTLRPGPLYEAPIHVDWFKSRKGARLTGEAFRAYLHDAFRRHDTVGIMLHHEHMDEIELSRLGGLLSLLGTHPNVALTSIRDAASFLTAAKPYPTKRVVNYA